MRKKATTPVIKDSKGEIEPLILIIDKPIHYNYKESSMYYPTLEGLRTIFFVEISHFKSLGNVTELHRVDKTIIKVLAGLGDIEASMPPEDFMRISNTSLVNLHEVAGLNNDHLFCVIMKHPLLPSGQTDNAEGGEIELDGSPKLKPEFLKRLLALGPNIKRR